jgi:hypothetical protein
MEVLLKQTLKIGITLVVVAALAMSGIALAQTSDDSIATEHPAYGRILEQLAPLVEDGTINADQAAAVAEHLTGSFKGPVRRPVRALVGLAAVADFLGLDGAELREAIGEYDTIAEIAEANGSSAEAVVEHLLGIFEGHLDQAIADGRTTEDQKAELLAAAEVRFTNFVNEPLPEPGERPHRRALRGPGPVGPGFGPGPGG